MPPTVGPRAIVVYNSLAVLAEASADDDRLQQTSQAYPSRQHGPTIIASSIEIANESLVLGLVLGLALESTVDLVLLPGWRPPQPLQLRTKRWSQARDPHG